MQGFPEKDITKLEDYGFIASRPRGEYHANNQQMAKLLHKAIGLGGKKAGPMVHYHPAPKGCNHFDDLSCSYASRLWHYVSCLYWSKFNVGAVGRKQDLQNNSSLAESCEAACFRK